MSKLETRLEEVRRLIATCAHTAEDVGEIEESLKWGQASFATMRPKSGTPIRIGGNETLGTYSLFVPCSTSLVSQFRDTHPDMFEYFGTREIRLSLAEPMPAEKLSLFITAALKYHLK